MVELLPDVVKSDRARVYSERTGLQKKDAYILVRTELPDTILVSVSHRSTVEQHHTHELELLGEGEWRFGRVEGEEKEPAPV